MNNLPIGQLLEPWKCTEVQLRKLPLLISIPRRVACVNAFQGIKEPAATIHAAKEALKSLVGKMEAAGWNGADMAQARDALARLEGRE
ncbi:MAG: hypothetical protein ABSF51_14570 [Verrucomicrobiota bacterium]|jgi:hypothetical protein